MSTFFRMIRLLVKRRKRKRGSIDPYPDLHTQNRWQVFIMRLNPESGSVYFNPSVCVTKSGKRFLFVRRCNKSGLSSARYPKSLRTNDIVVFELTKLFKLKNKTVLDLPLQFGTESVEDPRCVAVGSKMWLSCCTFVEELSLAHQAFFVLDDNLNALARFDPVYGKNFKQASVNDGHEKNWLWFMYDNRPHLIYNTYPHEVVRMTNEMEKDTVYVSNEINSQWKSGTPRGGSAPILYKGEWWTFFHSSVDFPGGRRQYHMGALAFENKPPFRISKMTSKPLLSGSDKHPLHENNHMVVFPGGAILEDGRWTVVFGVNDLNCGIITIPHSDLKKLCKPLIG